MMTLKLTKERKIDGVTYQNYKLGKYDVIVQVEEDGRKYIAVAKEWGERLLPDIYFDEGGWKNEEDCFKIQTAGYGTMKPEEIQKVIEGYQTAIEAVEVLTKAFL